jgi:hypothetical protein
LMKPWEQQPWVGRYLLALTETNRTKMPVQIEIAKSEVGARIRELKGSVGGAPELLALNDAVRFLRRLTLEAHC